MVDPLSIGGTIVGVIGLAIQITQAVVQLGLDWKDAPADVKTFMAELQMLNTTLSESNTNIILNPDFAEAFQNRPSLLLSQLGPDAPPTTDAKLMLQICEKQLTDLLRELQKRGKGHRLGWERIKGAFLAKSTRDSIENLHRQCAALNKLVSIDTAVLGVTTYKEVKETRREQQDARQELRDARKEQQQWHDDERVKNILNWLSTADHGSQQSDFLGRRQEGTGQWLLDSNEFQTWCNGNGDILFCPGMPGAGKTIMASLVIDYLRTKYRGDKSVAVAFLYCNFRRSDEQKPVDLLASLIKQLVPGLPSIPASVKSLYEYHNSQQTRPSLQEISRGLDPVIGAYSKCFVIVDALDECPTTNGNRQTFLAELLDLQANGKVNLFATSRDIPQIVQVFKDKSTTLEIRASDDDVRRYLNGQMTRLPSFVLRSVGLQEEIETEIVKVVMGMFLLAQLHLDSLVGVRSAKALRIALRKLPNGSDAYDRAYNDAMDRIQGQILNSQELAYQALSWITCAKRPLTTSELQHALAVEVGECELDKENLPEIEEVVSVCAGLVSVDQESEIIRLVHYTTQEFFERTQGDWFPDAQRYIAETCIIYLSFNIFGSGSCPSDDEFEARLRCNPLYDYAARNWGRHILGTSAEKAKSTLHFLKNRKTVTACSQAMMVTNYRYYGYSKRVPELTGIHLAAYFGLPQILVLLLERRNQSDCKDEEDRTPPSWAAGEGHEAVVKLLVERDGAEADSKDKFGRTPLSRAAEEGHEAVVRLLVERDDVEADSKDEDSRTPLSRAAEEGHEAVVRLLVERDDVEADSKDEDSRTPLSRAAERGHEAVVRLLVERDDVEADSKDNHGRTPLLRAAEEGHEAIVRLLVERDDVESDSKDEDGYTSLSRAAEEGHEAVVRLLVERDDVEADSKDEDGQTPLSGAAWRGHEAVVRLLVERNDVEADSKDNYGQTPLSWAARSGQEVVVKLLVERDDVEADSKDNDGRTPLSWAAEEGYEAVVKLLVERDDVEADSKDNNGRTPLSWAAEEGYEAVVKLLVERDDVKADSKDNDGRTPLLLAAGEGDEAVLKLLVERDDVDADSKDKYGRTPLSLAVERGYEAVVKLLTKYVNDPGLRN